MRCPYPCPLQFRPSANPWLGGLAAPGRRFFSSSSLSLLSSTPTISSGTKKRIFFFSSLKLTLHLVSSSFFSQSVFLAFEFSLLTTTEWSPRHLLHTGRENGWRERKNVQLFFFLIFFQTFLPFHLFWSEKKSMINTHPNKVFKWHLFSSSSSLLSAWLFSLVGKVVFWGDA